MPRTFSSSDYIHTGIGDVAAFTHGTYVVLCKRTTSGDGVIATLNDSGGNFRGYFGLPGDTGVVASYGGDADTATLSLASGDGWVLLAATKASGTATVDFHKYVYSTDTWTTEGAESVANGTAPGAGGRIDIGSFSASSNFPGAIAALAIFNNRKLTAAELALLPYSLAAWLSLAPNAMWVLDQHAVAQTVMDRTGGGANQSDRAGTTVTADSPPIGYGHPVIIARAEESPWLNRRSGIDAANGTNTHTVNLDFTSTSGSLLVVVAYGAVTHDATGWTERLSPANSGGLSVFTKTSAGDSSITITNNASNYAIGWIAYEFPAGASWTDGTSSNPTTDTLPTLSGLPGTAQVVIGAIGRIASTSGVTGASAVWTQPSTEDTDLFTPFATTDGLFFTAGSRSGVTATSVAPVTTPTYTGVNTPSDRQAVVFAIDLAGAGGATTHDATGTMAGTSTLTTTGFKVKTATGTQASTSTLTGAGFATRAAAGTQASTSTLTATGFVTRVATGTQAGVSALTTTGFKVKTATGTQASTSTLVGAGTAGQAQTHTATGTQAGVSALTGAATAVTPSQQHVPTPGWGGLIAVLAEARELHTEDSPPAACPHDGEPLSNGPNGELHCTYDGFVWRSGASAR